MEPAHCIGSNPKRDSHCKRKKHFCIYRESYCHCKCSKHFLHVFRTQYSPTSNAISWEHSCFSVVPPLKPTGFLISPAHVSVEAEDPLRRPPMTSIAQSSPLTLSPALKVGTCIKLCKCKSFILICFLCWCPCVLAPSSHFFKSCLLFRAIPLFHPYF